MTMDTVRMATWHQEIESLSDAEDEDHQNLLQQVESVTKRLAELVTQGGGVELCAGSACHWFTYKGVVSDPFRLRQEKLVNRQICSCWGVKPSQKKTGNLMPCIWGLAP